MIGEKAKSINFRQMRTIAVIIGLLIANCLFAQTVEENYRKPLKALLNTKK